MQRWLVTGLSNALVTSDTMVNELESELSVENALEACEANRETILLLRPGRLGHDDAGKIRVFLEDVRRAHKYTTIVAKKKGNEEAESRILEWAESEARRARILEARLAKDMDEVEKLLRETIEKTT